MKTRFIGDVHGKLFDYMNLIDNPTNPCTRSIQVGDFGFGFDQRKEYVAELNRFTNRPNHNHRFIRGNHDDPAVCKARSNYISDGHTEDDIMFIGGANSIDRATRVEGVSWWPDEELSYSELSDIQVKYNDFKPRVMVTHECPESVVGHMFDWYAKKQFKSVTRQAFDMMWQYHKPDIWIFGHWHADRDVNIMGTRFICLNELSFIDLDV